MVKILDFSSMLDNLPFLEKLCGIMFAVYRQKATSFSEKGRFTTRIVIKELLYLNY